MKHLFTLSEWLRAKWERFATLASSAMQSLKATKRQSDTTIFAERVQSAKSIFANRGVKDVRVSLGQYRTDYQRISNLYLTPNRFFTRFAAVFAFIFVLGVGNVWGTEGTEHNYTTGNTREVVLNNKASISPISITNLSYPVKKVAVTCNYNKSTAGVTVSCTVNNEAFGTPQTINTNTTTTFNFEGSSTSGDVVISFVNNTNASSKMGTFKVTAVVLTEGASASSTPTITAGSLSPSGDFGFNLSTGVAEKKSFTVSGSNLTANISVTPPTGYEISTSENGTYQTSAITLTQSSGSVSSTTIWARLRSRADINAGSYSGNIACTSTGATARNIAVSGSAPFKVTWSSSDNATFATTYVAYATSPGTALGSLPATVPTCAGKYLYGWYDGESYSHASIAPSIVNTATEITTDKTFIAVFANRSGSAPTWDKITSAPNDWSGEYVIVNPNGSDAMISDFYSGTSGEFKSEGVTIKSDGSQITSTPSNKMIWIVAKNGNNNQYSFQNKSTGTYAEITGTSSTNAALNSNAVWFTIATSGTTGVWKVNSVTNSARCFAWYSSNSTFRTYANSSNNTGKLFKKSGGYTYSNYATTCCTELAQINGSINLSHF